MLILASSSPRRKEILSLFGKRFRIEVPGIDESILKLSPKDQAMEESRIKAYAIYSRFPEEEILSCDTIVVLGKKILGKPKDEEDAVRMLLEESGKKQTVISGYTYIGKGKEITRSVISKVYFNKLSEEDIRAYVKEKKPLDKAGAYGIQDEWNLINRIDGSYYNVMGLPIEDILKHTPI